MSLAEGRMVGIGVVLKDLDGRFQRGARSRSSDAGSRSATIPSSIAPILPLRTGRAGDPRPPRL